MNSTLDEHIDLVSKILTTLSNHDIKVNWGKSEFFGKVEFLGHIISSKGIKKSPQFIEKIAEYPKPAIVTQLRQFLGLVNFQRKFVHQLSTIVRPLTQLTGGPKGKKIVWTSKLDEAFEGVKELVKEFSLSFPDYSDNDE